MKRYLTSQGLQTLWNQIKALFATKAELNQKASKTELNTLSESVSASLSEIEQTDIRQDASISSLSENKADKTVLNKLSTDTTAALDKKVDKVSGMGLSHNDYTDEDKAKLDGIEENANNYSLPVAGSALGGVKSGGDITIQPDGTMQVNDDSHNHSASNINSGTLPIVRGGTGGSTRRVAEFNLLGSDDSIIDNSNIDDNRRFALLNMTVSAENGAFRWMKFSGVWTYIQTKIKDVLSLTASNYNGTAAKATADGSGNNIVQTYATKTENNNKVDKVEGKGLSTNDYTTAEKNKLSGVASGAEVNTIVAVQRNGTAITPKDRVVNILVPVKTSELNNDSTYQTAADVAETIVGVKLDLASGIITLTRKNGTTFTLDLPTEKIIKSGRYDSETEEIVLVLEDESEIRFSASELIDEYYADESTLELYTDTSDGNKKKFRLKTAYKNKIDGSEQTTNKTASVSSSSTETQYPTAKAVYNAVKDLATKVQTFTQANTRSNIESGETIATIFGKIRKWFADLKTVAFSGSYDDLIDKPTIGNGKVTIKQKGVEKGSFAMNQSGDATIELTDENTTYGIATSATAGLVKSGTDITVDADGNVSVKDNSHSHYYDSGPYYGESGKNGYVNFCTITFDSRYQDEPFSFQISSRNREGTLTIFPNLANSTTLSNPRFFWHSEYVGLSPVWYKVELNKIYLYYQKSESNDEISVIRRSVGVFTTKGTTFIWGNTYVTSSDGLTNVAKYNYYVNCDVFNIKTTSDYTIDTLWTELQSNTGKIGAVFLNKKTSGIGSTIVSGWYNFIYVPYGDGVNSDRPKYGTVILTPFLANDNSTSWVLRIANSSNAITSVQKMTNYGISDISGLQAELNTYRKLSGCLELTDSNLATYFNSSTGVLTIPNGVTTILFNTNYVQKVFNIIGTCAVNGYRLSIAGRWQPAEKTSSSTTGCFSSYIYGYRGGAVSYGTQYSSEMREAFEDFIYFNGVWYSKAY